MPTIGGTTGPSSPDGPGEASGRLRRLLVAAVEDGVCSAAAAAISVDGAVLARSVVGDLATVDDPGQPIPASERRAAGDATRFDLASLAKTFSAATLLALVSEGVLELDAPVAGHLAEYRTDTVRARVTLRHLMTHTSGLPDRWAGYEAPFAAAPAGAPQDLVLRDTPVVDRRALRSDLARTPLVAPPGERWEYSCAGYNTAMLVAEAATGESWPELVERTVLRPCGLLATGFAPRRAGLDDVVATEREPLAQRGVIRGDVHDSASWHLGGATANAGLFAALDDVVRWAETIRRGEGPTAGMLDDQLSAVLPDPSARPAHGVSLGLRLGEASWMGDGFPRGAGHTGFTGTSSLVDARSGTSVVLLTNRVHPSREGPSATPLRLAVADLATSLARAPR